MTEPITQPLVSVMIPYYNCKDYIAETIESVEKQTYTAVEIIVVNDGSSENHASYLTDLLHDKPHIRLLHQTNKGVSAARNKAAAHAAGRYFVFLDADDVIGERYIELAVGCFQEHPDLVLVYPATELFDGATGLFTPPAYRTYRDLLMWNTFPTPSVHKAEDYRRINGFNESLATHEDWDYWIRLLQNNDRVCKLPEVLYFYRKRRDNTSLMDGLRENPEKVVQDWQKVYWNNEAVFLKNNLGYFDLINKINQMERDLNMNKDNSVPESESLQPDCLPAKLAKGEPLSVGIVLRTTKNRLPFLKRALDSITNQSYPEWKLLVVNDAGSADDIDRMVQPYQSAFPDRLAVIHLAENKGTAEAANTGLLNLDTDLAVFHDDDDSWSPDFLLRTVQVYRNVKNKLPSIGGVVCHANRVIEEVEGHLILTKHVENFNQHIGTGLLSLREAARGNFIIPLIGFVFELAAARKTELFDAGLPVLSDWDFCLKFMLQQDVWLQSETLAFVHYREKNYDEYQKNSSTDLAEAALYRVYLENKWLRNDIRKENASIGMVMNLWGK